MIKTTPAHEAMGKTARDRITGFKGVVTAYAQYISGCHQILLCPPVKEDGSAIDGRWFDTDRLELQDNPQIQLHVTAPGPDLPAPVR